MQHSLLLDIPVPAPREFLSYLNSGRKKGVHLTSHSLRRVRWYKVDMGEVPDAFFHYRVSSIPFLSLNTGRLQCTNSVHRVYFRNGDVNIRRWSQISLLSKIGQLSIEASAKVYGNGILKIEPASLKQSLICTPASPVPIEPIPDYISSSGCWAKERCCERGHKSFARSDEFAESPCQGRGCCA